MTARDDEGLTSTGEDQVTIQNSLPTPPIIEILPENPMPRDGMAVFITQLSTDADGDAIVYLFEWYRLDSEGNWDRRPEVSGSLSPFSPGEPEISGLYTAGEVWKVEVTPYEARTLAKRSGLKGVEDAIAGPPAVNRWIVLPDLDDDGTIDHDDVIDLVEIYHEEGNVENAGPVEVKGTGLLEGVPTADDLILVSPLGWQRRARD